MTILKNVRGLLVATAVTAGFLAAPVSALAWNNYSGQTAYQYQNNYSYNQQQYWCGTYYSNVPCPTYSSNAYTYQNYQPNYQQTYSYSYPQTQYSYTQPYSYTYSQPSAYYNYSYTQPYSYSNSYSNSYSYSQPTYSYQTYPSNYSYYNQYEYTQPYSYNYSYDTSYSQPWNSGCYSNNCSYMNGNYYSTY